MGFADKLKKLNAHRLQQSVKATVQSNGRLTFTAEATKEMKLHEDKSLIIFAADGGDLGATISKKGDPDAFTLKKCGQYFYVAFKNYLQETGVDYKGQRIIYDITQLDESLEGRTLWKFERRILPRVPEQISVSTPHDNNNGIDGQDRGKDSNCGLETDDECNPCDSPSEGTPSETHKNATAPFDPDIQSSTSQTAPATDKQLSDLDY